jgi:serine/threonine-protein kinase
VGAAMAHTGDAAGDAVTSPGELGTSLVLRARSRVGSTLLRGKWHLDALLGIGGMAAVYAATHRNGRRAAIKVLHLEASLDSQCRGRFLREGRLANAVGHDGAVKVLDDDDGEHGPVFLVLELLEGESLAERCKRLGGRLPEREVLWVADQLLDVLVAAHSRGIVHRDIKPGNLLLTCSGSVKVLDFGIARWRQLSTLSTATSLGGAMGTPAFMAPEQARGLWEEVDARSDLFAVGATMFTLLSGRYVHDGRTQNEEMLSAMTVRAPLLSSVVPGVADKVASVIDDALAFHKSERWPDARSMQEAVRSAYRDRTGMSISTAPRPSIPDAVVHAKFGPSRDMAAPPTEPSVAKDITESTRMRQRRFALTFAVVVAAVFGIGMALVRPGYSSPQRPVALTPPAPFVLLASPSVATGSSTVVVEQASAPEPPVVARTEPLIAPTSAGAPKAAAASKPATKGSCATPFVIDPITHIKHWKVDCL